MICLERLDGRAFSLPFNVVPSVDLARGAVRGSLTFMFFLFPYMLSIGDRMSSELLCPTE